MVSLTSVSNKTIRSVIPWAESCFLLLHSLVLWACSADLVLSFVLFLNLLGHLTRPSRR